MTKGIGFPSETHLDEGGIFYFLAEKCTGTDTERARGPNIDFFLNADIVGYLSYLFKLPETSVLKECLMSPGATSKVAVGDESG